jgi:putative transposase
MKRKYQIEKQRAVQGFRRLAQEENPAVQMTMPMAEVAAFLQEGVGHLLRQAGLALMQSVMDQEVCHLAGERHAQGDGGSADRWGTETGYCVIDGQKVPIQRQRLRGKNNQEVRLGSYELFQRQGPLQNVVWEKMTRGLSTRNYAPVIKQFAEAYGVEKSAVSENFIETSRAKLKELMERRLDKLKLCAIIMDGTPFHDHQMIVALGIGCDGRKSVLGLREGGSENTAVISAMLDDMITRGLDVTIPRLYVLDGGKALQTAIKQKAGDAALIQRCQVHKKRNVIDHLTEEHKSDVKRKLQNAYNLLDYQAAKQALHRLVRELMDINPSAARSLEEGLEETLTVHRLAVPEQLRRTLSSTNVIESAFSIVENVCRNVKRWQKGDQVERWVGTGLLVAERQFRKVIGVKHISAFLSALAAASASPAAAKPLAKTGKVA